MKQKAPTQSEEPLEWQAIGGRPRFRVTMISLLIFVLGVSCVGRVFGLWPIVAWPMYSTKEAQFPPPSAYLLALRATGSDGAVRVATPFDFMPLGSTQPIRENFEGAFTEPDTVLRNQYRAYLANTLERLQRRRIETIEGLRIEYNVDPLATPPVEKNRPAREVLLGGYSAVVYSGRERDR